MDLARTLPGYTDSPRQLRGRPPALKGSRRRFLVAAATGLVMLTLIYVAAFETEVGREFDQEVLHGFSGLPHPRMAQLVEPLPFAAAGLFVVLGARLVRGVGCAAGVSLVLVGASVSAQLLKLGLAQPRSVDWLPEWAEVAPASWPSGHATASMSLALCAVLAAPARWRPLVGTLGAVLPLGVSLSMLARGFHFPSDMVAGYVMAAVWALMVVAAAGLARPTSIGKFARALAFPALAGVLGTLAGIVLVTQRPHPAFIVGTVVLVIFGLGLPAGLAAALNAAPGRAASTVRDLGRSRSD
jgi:membrane-associated phospholipid phosphatase